MIVIERIAAAAMAKVLVKASGLNSRPDCPVSAKIGRKLTTIISSEKNNWGPTSRQASMMICECVRVPSFAPGVYGRSRSE